MMTVFQAILLVGIACCSPFISSHMSPSCFLPPMAEGFSYSNNKRQYFSTIGYNNQNSIHGYSHSMPGFSSQDGNTLSRTHRPSYHRQTKRAHATTPLFMMDLNTLSDISTTSTLASTLSLDIGRDQAEALAGPFFGLSLFPYLAFLWFLARPENECPKGVTVGFATCLLFVFLTIPAAIAAQLLYGVSLADCDWLHGSAESLLTITNLVTVVAFRQALSAKEQQQQQILQEDNIRMPRSATSWAPMTWLVVGLTVVAAATALVPALNNPQVHTPYLNGFMDLPSGLLHAEPDNALTIATWIIHISSLVEFLVAMGFCWRWADVVQNPTWKGLTWGLLPLHSSGITACTYHLFFNRIPILVPIQALLTCVGNTTAALAAYRIARSNGWEPSTSSISEEWIAWADALTNTPKKVTTKIQEEASFDPATFPTKYDESETFATVKQEENAASLVGFEDLGQALAGDNDYSFLFKLFAGCAVASYIIKYGELYFDLFFDASVVAGLAFIAIPSSLNAYKWYRRGKDPSFEGWF